MLAVLGSVRVDNLTKNSILFILITLLFSKFRART